MFVVYDKKDIWNNWIGIPMENSLPINKPMKKQFFTKTSNTDQPFFSHSNSMKKLSFIKAWKLWFLKNNFKILQLKIVFIFLKVCTRIISYQTISYKVDLLIHKTMTYMYITRTKYRFFLCLMFFVEKSLLFRGHWGASGRLYKSSLLIMESLLI